MFQALVVFPLAHQGSDVEVEILMMELLIYLPLLRGSQLMVSEEVDN